MNSRRKPDQEILNLVNGSRIVAEILWQRGYRDPEAVKAFLNPAFYQATDPLELQGMAEAVVIMANALKEGKKIAVYGDYDADGITSTALLVRTLKQLGGKISWQVPNRFTGGYGLSVAAVEELAWEGAELILTCDCGISSHDAVLKARELGLTIVVTDHHELPEELPLAHAIVNPRLLTEGHPCQDLCGVGVAYMLALALSNHLGVEFDQRLLQLVALGTVADVVPLRAENRYLVQRGLAVLNSNNTLPGIKALLDLTRSEKVDEETIGFYLAPRLNAPGRMASAAIGVELLLTEDLEEARPLAAEIDAANLARRQLVEDIVGELEGYTPHGSIILFNENWAQGVTGIVAGRLCEKFDVPAVLMTIKAGTEDVVTGSARSVPGVNMYEGLAAVQQYLTGFGGHAGAAGFSLERGNLEKFIPVLQKVLDKDLTGQPVIRKPDITLSFREMTLESCRELERLAPFGEGNPRPRFSTDKTAILSVRPIGDGQHYRLTLGQDGFTHGAVWWRAEDIPSAECSVRAVYSLGCNRFRGIETVQLNIISLEETPEVSKPVVRPALEIIDSRIKPGLLPHLELEPGCCSFAEGQPKGMNRYTITPCDTLVLLTIPPHLRVIREMVARSGCSRLILAYLVLTTNASLIKRLMGAIKQFSHQGGAASIEDLAAATGELEITVWLGLRLLRESGLLSFEADGTKLQITLLGDGKINTRSRTYRNLRTVERETRAFRYFMANARLDQIERILE
ncbi:MAG: single-stranded-DNA-specific exonuclease RecJ [Chitinophagales bacterium]